MDSYDFVQLVVYDIHSKPRGRLVAQRRLAKAMENGVGNYSGICFPSVQGETNMSPYFGSDRNLGNATLVPIMDTLVPVHMSSNGNKRVGEVMCDLILQDGSKEPNTPRLIAEKQINRLADCRLAIKSAFEVEFGVLDKKGVPWGSDYMSSDMNIIRRREGVFLEMFEELAASDVHVDTLMAEAGPGQYEVTFDIAEGLKSPDMATRFKNMSKLYLERHDLNATCMTQYIKNNDNCNGLHFNHSLWDSDGHNVFIDSDNPSQLSAIGQHWLAGLILHGPALTALCCPTVNCYRRLFKAFTSSTFNWGKDDRMAAFRLIVGKNNIYLESRIPSGAASPYLVMAATVAAGLDGVERKLSLDGADQNVPLPKDLESALDELQRDSVIVNALGASFVDNFVYVKQTWELEKIKPFKCFKDPTLYDEEMKLYHNC